ncbi:MAG TPA: hypothetical protein VFG15_15030 [Amycolatopsis sp.]|nr:hypothetical protein [Amycolatopsis sp.]
MTATRSQDGAAVAGGCCAVGTPTNAAAIDSSRTSEQTRHDGRKKSVTALG